MRIMVPVSQPGIDVKVDHKLGRGHYWLVVDSETLQYETYKNQYAEAECNAGIQAARFALEHEIGVVLAFDFGPKAYAGLRKIGVEMHFTRDRQTAREAVEAYLAGELEIVTAPSKEGHGFSSKLPA